MGAGALWALSLNPFMARRAEGAAIVGPYGPISAEDRRDDRFAADSASRWIPVHVVTGGPGDLMADDVRCPNLHDGMAVVDVEGNSGRVILVRNHEGGDGDPYLNKPSITYLADGAGGTTNLIFDTKHGRWAKAWSTLAGTIRNCAGGVTPWRSWISGEETFGPGHGYAFDVGAQKGDPQTGRRHGPLLARSDDGGSGDRVGVRNGRRDAVRASTGSSRMCLASSSKAASCTCSR